MEWTSEINRDPAAGNLIPRLDLCPARGNNLSLSLSLSRGYIAGDLQPKFAPPERSIRVFTGRAPTKEPRRPNFMKHGAVYRERSGRESNTNSRFCTSLSLSLSLSVSVFCSPNY